MTIDQLVTGKDAFVLWDTYGFPVDLTQLMAEEAGLKVDVEGYHQAMEDAKELSRRGFILFSNFCLWCLLLYMTLHLTL